jgi:phosphatidylserine/phosphatidylglycerophosphate/cardiolipin synthase-like enzyme
MPTLAVALSAVDHFSETIHIDETQAEVVLTSPSCSSSLEQHLEDRGWKASAIEPTHQAFLDIVQGARDRVVIMTPFLDAYGASWLQDLIGQIRSGVTATVVLRSLEDPTRTDYPSAYASIGGWLAERSVSVVNYSIPRDRGLKRETFHAKVISADRSAAYVGSANLTLASRDYSMELGVVLRGRAAKVIAEVVDAVLLCAEPVIWTRSTTSALPSEP